MRVSRIPFLVLICAVVATTWLVLQPGTGESQPPPPTAAHWDNRFLTALTPDSLLARHTTFDPLPDGMRRLERVVPFLLPQDFLAMGSDFMGCPCCPEPRYPMNDTLPPGPRCCVPCLTMFELQTISRRDPIEIMGEEMPFITTRDTLPRGIVSIYGAVEVRRNGNATDPLPLTLDIHIKGVTAVPIGADTVALSASVPPGTRENGHLRVMSMRRDFRVSGGGAEITLTTKMTGEHNGEQIADGVIGIVYLPDMRSPGME